MKKLKALILSLCVFFTMSPVTLAADLEDSNVNGNTSVADEVQLPSDAKILAQNGSIIIYQSKMESDDANKSGDRSPVDYESVWLNSNGTGSFQIYNSRSGLLGVTWKIESSSNNSHALIYMTTPYGLFFLNVQDIYPSDGDVWFRTTGVQGYYTVYYIGYTTVGMRIMCWMYD